MTATTTAELTGLSVRSVNAIYLRIRSRIAEHCERQSPFPHDAQPTSNGDRLPVPQTFPNRSSERGSIMFGIRRRDDAVYAEIVADDAQRLLQPVVRGRAPFDDIANANGMYDYEAIVDVAYDRHLRIDRDAPNVAGPGGRIHVSESFWSFSKRRLTKFNGISRRTFYLHLKECEFRFNARNSDLYLSLLRMLRSHPL